MCAERVIDEFDAEGLSQVWKDGGVKRTAFWTVHPEHFSPGGVGSGSHALCPR